MTVYKCDDCNQTFDKPQAVEESRGEFWGMPAYETMYYCPYCGSEAIDEVEEEIMRDYTAYIESLEDAGEKHTADEWREIINLEAEDMEDYQTIADVDNLVEALEHDGYVLTED